MPEVTVIMYHYIRDLKNTRYPNIKGLEVSKFKNQIKYLSDKNYNFVTVEQCIKAIYSENADFPKNAVLLTFDDGYLEHYTNIFPILNALSIQGAFFPPVQAIMERKVLDVNKIHFILASTDQPKKLMDILNKKILDLTDEYDLDDPEVYKQKLDSSEHRYDPIEIIYVKRLLQRELPKEPRRIILDELFTEFVGIDEEVFANELYMSVDQLRCMHRNGMFIGGHGHTHKWLNVMNEEEQRKEVNLTKRFLAKIGADIDNWVMCYPYGAYNESLIDILKRSNCQMGITTTIGNASLVEKNAFSIQRIDTNDLQKTIEHDMSLHQKSTS